MSIKFRVLGCILGFGGGEGECRFYFYGRQDFSARCMHACVRARARVCVVCVCVF